MTIATYVKIARHPDRYSTEQLRAALDYWHERAGAAPFGQGGEDAARHQLCLDALRARTTE
jgi:hypothetical protein